MRIRGFTAPNRDYCWLACLNADDDAGIDSTFAGFSITDQHAIPCAAYRVLQDFAFSGYAATVQ